MANQYDKFVGNPYVAPDDLGLLEKGLLYQDKYAQDNLDFINQGVDYLHNMPSIQADVNKKNEIFNGANNQIQDIAASSNLSDPLVLNKIRGVVRGVVNNPDTTAIANHYNDYLQYQKNRTEAVQKDGTPDSHLAVADQKWLSTTDFNKNPNWYSDSKAIPKFNDYNKEFLENAKAIKASGLTQSYDDAKGEYTWKYKNQSITPEYAYQKLDQLGLISAPALKSLNYDAKYEGKDPTDKFNQVAYKYANLVANKDVENTITGTQGTFIKPTSVPTVPQQFGKVNPIGPDDATIARNTGLGSPQFNNGKLIPFSGLADNTSYDAQLSNVIGANKVLPTPSWVADLPGVQSKIASDPRQAQYDYYRQVEPQLKNSSDAEIYNTIFNAAKNSSKFIDNTFTLGDVDSKKLGAFLFSLITSKQTKMLLDGQPVDDLSKALDMEPSAADKGLTDPNNPKPITISPTGGSTPGAYIGNILGKDGKQHTVEIEGSGEQKSLFSLSKYSSDLIKSGYIGTKQIDNNLKENPQNPTKLVINKLSNDRQNIEQQVVPIEKVYTTHQSDDFMKKQGIKDSDIHHNQVTLPNGNTYYFTNTHRVIKPSSNPQTPKEIQYNDTKTWLNSPQMVPFRAKDNEKPTSNVEPVQQ